MTRPRTFVGFGFGAIQAGLFLYEAYQSGAFGRLVVAEVMPDVVSALREANGKFSLNIAQQTGIESVEISGIEIENPAESPDRQRLIDAIAHADEISTAIPSVTFYKSDSPGSLHHVFAEGLRRKVARNLPHAVIYAAENNNQAAEILEAHVLEVIPANERDSVHLRVRFLNTVIGKMSGVITNPTEIEAQNLQPITPGSDRAFLVEAFNRILISQIDFAEPFERGITVFEEKSDLLSFEEAKLFGHNGTHAQAAYLGAFAGIHTISDLRDNPVAMEFLRAALIEESGAALIRKYVGVDDLFTEAGFAQYVDDLLERMTNPFLRDSVERVGRDPARKLGWNDRLIGAMRLVLSQGIEPQRYALGAAAALIQLEPAALVDSALAETRLLEIWHDAKPDPDEVAAIFRLVHAGLARLKRGFRWVIS
jgi:mannitol-1-phosphate 5-dehydrogenase